MSKETKHSNPDNNKGLKPSAPPPSTRPQGEPVKHGLKPSSPPPNPSKPKK